MHKDTYSTKTFNYKRKLYHLAGFALPLGIEFDIFGFLNTFFMDASRIIAIIIFTSGLCTLFTLDILRFHNRKVNFIFLKIFKKLMKKDEALQHHSSIPYLFACILLLFFGTKTLITLACTYLMISDPFAAYIGSKFGRIRFNNGRSLEGFLGFLFISIFVPILYFSISQYFDSKNFYFPVYQNESLNLNVFILAFFGALVAGLAEFFSRTFFRGLIDDNLLVPLAGSLSLILVGVYGFSYPVEYFIYNFIIKI